jgi:alkyl hydroperoxide reductase subunit F
MGYKYIEGIELVEKFKEQVRQFEIGISDGKKAVSIADGDIKLVTLEDGSEYQARTLIITTGKSYRRLNVPGEREFAGRGVAYCAICDAPLFIGKRVVVVGGGNSGVEAAIDLAKVATRVTVVQNLEDLTADKILRDSLIAFENVDILYEHVVTMINGTQSVETVNVESLKNGGRRSIDAQGVFVEIGLIPNIEMVRGLLELNEMGEIVIDNACRTNRPGIFAAGDVTSVPFKQIIIAGGEGAKAALAACDYLLREAKSIV